MRLKNKFLSLVGVVNLIFGTVGENQLSCLAMNAESEIKTVFLGDMGVGKTSIIGRLTQGKFFSVQTLSVGALIQEIKLKNGERLSVWDATGQEQFRSTIPLYLRGAKIIVLVFDLSKSDREIVKRHLTSWIEIVNNTDLNVRCILVGNKLDLCRSSKEEVKNEFTKFAQEHKIEKFLICSALTGEGIDELKGFLTVLSSKCKQSDKIHNVINIEDIEIKSCCS